MPDDPPYPPPATEKIEKFRRLVQPEDYHFVGEIWNPAPMPIYLDFETMREFLLKNPSFYVPSKPPAE